MSELEIDASNMKEVDDKIVISDIVLPKGVELADKELDPEQVVASLYDPAAEAEKRAESAVNEPQTKVSPIGQVSAEDIHEALEGAEAILFKSPTCPNCKAAMALLDRAGVKYAAVNAADARELTAKYGVKQAPTLVVRTEDGFEKYRGVSDITGWLMHTPTR